MAEEVGVEPTRLRLEVSTALKAARPTGGDALPLNGYSNGFNHRTLERRAETKHYSAGWYQFFRASADAKDICESSIHPIDVADV